MKNAYFRRIIFLVIAILFIYSAYWLFISIQFKAQIKNNLDRIEMENSVNYIAFGLILLGILVTVFINNYVEKKNIRIDR